MKLNFVIAFVTVALPTVVIARRCQNVTIPVSITARNGNFSLDPPTTNIETTNFALNEVRLGQNYTAEVLNGYHTVTGQYDIGATYCQPDGELSSHLQILTHGIGFDRRYWDPSINGYNYSYVREATDVQNYATLYYDRLGTGLSSHPNPIQETQLFLEVEVLAALTDMARAGTLPVGDSVPFDTIVQVGHSYGSATVNALSTVYPNISDAIVLTGFSTNSSFAGIFLQAGSLVPVNTSRTNGEHIPDGYIAVGNEIAAQSIFFAPDDFDPAVLTYSFTIGQEIAPAEFLTIGGLAGGKNTFEGQVLIVTGDRDTSFCGGDCLATGDPDIASIPAASAKAFPLAQDFNATIIPLAGHGLNFAYSHVQTYAAIFDYLQDQGLSPTTERTSS